MVIHLQAFRGQRLNEILFRHAPFVGSSLSKNVSDAHQFVVWDGNPIAAHPSFRYGNRLGSKEVDHGPVVFGTDQLPSTSHEVQTNNLTLVKGFPEGFV